MMGLVLNFGKGVRMDPVTIGAVLLAIVSGVSGKLGEQLWGAVVSLVHHPFRRNIAGGDEAAASTVLPSGEAELAALRRDPDDEHKAVALAEALLARSGSDDEFRRALENWWEQAEPIRASISAGNVANTISGGTLFGPALMGRDFSNITFGAGQAAPPPVPPSPDQGT
jgi:hypothetical protein